MIELRKINEDNFEECMNLEAIVPNENFVDSVAWSLAEAYVLGDDARPFAIYADDKMVGYVLMYVQKNHYQIINFLIDSRFQKKGYGRKTAQLCVDYLSKEHSAKEISLPVYQENVIVQKLWKSLGFKISKDIEDGYKFMRLAL